MSLRYYLKLKEPGVPPANDYASIVDYLQKCQQRSANYYRIILGIGGLGFILWVGFLLYLVQKYNSWDILFSIKALPGFISSMATAGFAHLEMEAKKEKLYKQLRDIMQNHAHWDDENTITDDYKKWAWAEFQDRFKPEKP
jgi:hypothetical protein